MQQRSKSKKVQAAGTTLFQTEDKQLVWKISHQFHTGLTPTSHHFHKLTAERGQSALTDKGGNLYDIFRFGVVLVAGDHSGAGSLYPVQD